MDRRRNLELRRLTLSMNRIPVAQVFNLLYRRVALGKAVDNSGASDADADYKSAMQQSTTLRHMPTPVQGPNVYAKAKGGFP